MGSYDNFLAGWWRLVVPYYYDNKQQQSHFTICIMIIMSQLIDCLVANDSKSKIEQFSPLSQH
jgi:hypothetical protein